jgi:hypothetical protein
MAIGPIEIQWSENGGYSERMPLLAFVIFSQVHASDFPSDLFAIPPTRADSLALTMAYGGVREEYARDLHLWLRTQLESAAKASLVRAEKGDCSSKVRFLDIHAQQPPKPSTEGETVFVDGIFATESSYCLQGASAHRVHDIYMGVSFRETAMPGMASYTTSETGSCTLSDSIAGLMLATEYCSHFSKKTEGGMITVYGTLSSSAQGPKRQPIYLRDEIIFFAPIGDDVLLYRLTYTRGQDLGAVGKYFLSKTMVIGQNSIEDALNKEINGN